MNWGRETVNLRRIAILIALASSGCMFGSLKSNLDQMEEHAEVTGEVSAEDWNEKPLIVGVLRLAERDGAPDHPYDKYEMTEPGEYTFYLPPGRYRFLAYEDTNNNFSWDEAEGERIASYSNFSAVELRATEMRGHVDIHITDRPIRDRPEVSHEQMNRRERGMGDVTPLTAERFGPETGPRGLWSPMEFLDTPGWGVYQLQEFEQGKVPVLFVHGISGYPQEFTQLIAGLDRERFQPWVLHYPSGFDLDIIATAMQRVLNEIRHEAGYEHMCVVAHSMGGVLMRLFLKNHREEEARFVHTYVSIVSPVGGMASAGMGASSAPVVVPSWRNLDPAGNTIPVLFDTPLPDGLEYHLFFAHQDGESDTVVALSSQLRAEAMAEAVDMHGFSGTHTSVLRDPRASEHLNSALTNCGNLPAPVAPAPEEAPAEAPAE